jgi:hypothetical protein
MEIFLNNQFGELLGGSFTNERQIILKLAGEIDKNMAETIRLLDELTIVVKDTRFEKLTIENLADDIDFYVRVKCTIFIKPNKVYRSFILLNHNEIAKNHNEIAKNHNENPFEIPDDF